MILNGRGQFLFDQTDRAYLDCVNNVSHVGHSHPKEVAELSEQASVLNTNTRYLHPTIVEYAERLTATLPDPLSVCYFVNSGSGLGDVQHRWAGYNRLGEGKCLDEIAIPSSLHGYQVATPLNSGLFLRNNAKRLFNSSYSYQSYEVR